MTIEQLVPFRDLQSIHSACVTAHLFMRFFLPPTLTCGTIIIVLVLMLEMLFYKELLIYSGGVPCIAY